MTPFAADTALVARVLPSPNHNPRRNGRRPDMVILHYTGMDSGEVAIARLRDPDSEVSSHYVVEEDGTILQLVPESERAWHAGRGSWAGEGDLNSASIGIEIVNGGHPHGCPAYPAVQIAAVIALCRDIAGRHALAPGRIVAHSDIAPDRKEDPGEHFPWERLAAAGVGLWTDPAPITDGPILTQGDGGEEVRQLQADLRRLGYGIEASATYDEATRLAVTAFQRHWRPSRVDGVADRSTRHTLAALLAISSPLRAD